MSDERLLELVSAGADGELSESERSELERALAASPDARRFRAELARIETIMRDLPPQIPPDSLHERIVAAVTLPSSRRRRSFGDWFCMPEPMAALRYGMAAAAGVFAAALFFEAQPRFGATPDIGDLAGTMAAKRQAGSAEVVDSMTVRSDDFDSQVRLERRDDGLLLDIRIDAELAVDVHVLLADAGLRLGALLQDRQAFESIEIDAEGLRLRAVGKRQLTALLHQADDRDFGETERIELEYSSNGKLLQRVALQPAL